MFKSVECRRSSMKVAVLLAGLLIVLAGCAASPAATDDGQSSHDAPDANQGPGAATPNGQGPGTDAEVAVGTASLFGRIHDPANLSVIGARIDVLGTEARTTSAENGNFSIDGLPHGKTTVRVESGGFVTREIEVTLQKAKAAELDIELLQDAQFGAGFTAHVHDLWGTQTTRLLMDDIVPIESDGAGGRSSVPAAAAASDASGSAAANPGPTRFQRTNQGQVWEYFLPDSPDGLPNTVWPGTAEIRFSATWGTEPENKMPRVGFYALDVSAEAHDTVQLQKAPYGAFAGTVTRGGTVSLLLNSSSQTDNGHAVFTGWRFHIFIDNNIQKAPNWEPVVALGDIQVTIEIVKGQTLVLDPAHQDWWGDGDTLVIGDPKADYRPGGSAPVPSDCMTVVCLLNLRAGNDFIPVIPPGTQSLTVRFTYRLDQPAPLTYSFLYRTADQSPRDTLAADMKVPKLVESGPGWGVYEIPVDSGEADPFYVTKSNWAFKWTEKNPSGQSQYYFGSYLMHLGFEITAHKHPDF